MASPRRLFETLVKTTDVELAGAFTAAVISAPETTAKKGSFRSMTTDGLGACDVSDIPSQNWALAGPAAASSPATTMLRVAADRLRVLLSMVDSLPGVACRRV